MTAPALLAISHGTANPAGQAAVAGLVEAVAARLPDVTVRLGHVDVQQPDVTASLATLPDDQPVVLVPLLLSAGYHVHVDLAEQTAHRERLRVTAALGPDPRLVDVLAGRLEALAPAPGDTVVLAVAGSSDERANDDCRATARMLGERLDRPVEVGFLAAVEPRLGEAVSRARGTNEAPDGTGADTIHAGREHPTPVAGRRVAVANYLLAPGYFHDLAVRLSDGSPVAAPLLGDDAPPEAMVDLVIDRYRQTAASV